MKRYRLRRWGFAFLLGLLVCLLWTTGLAILPRVREHCIATALALSEQPGVWWPSTWEEEYSFRERYGLPSATVRPISRTQALKIVKKAYKFNPKGFELSWANMGWNVSVQGSSTEFRVFGADINGRVLVVDTDMGFRSPSATVYSFDRSGKLKGSKYFPIGPDRGRTSFTDVISVRIKEQNLLRIDTNNNREYYGFIDDLPVLARLEDQDGMLTRINYYFRMMGPSAPQRRPVDWEAALDSNDEIEVLRTLGWLGGIHYVRRRDWRHKPSSEVEVLECLLAKKSLRRTVRELLQSENSWIREAAQLVLESQPTDLFEKPE